MTALRDGALVGTRPMAEVDRAELIRMMVGRELSAVFPKVDVPTGRGGPGGPRAWAAGRRASTTSSLQVRAGEILGLAGLVGAGRTELARVLFGLTPADAGDDPPARRAGRRSTRPAQAVELGIAYVPEDRRRHGVILEMSVAANATLATLRAISPLGLLDFGRERDVAADFVERLGDQDGRRSTTPVGNLSGGNQQKVALARWLAAEPGGADPRRADAGGGRRGQGRDPPADGRAGRRRGWRS